MTISRGALLLAVLLALTACGSSPEAAPPQASSTAPSASAPLSPSRPASSSASPTTSPSSLSTASTPAFTAVSTAPVSQAGTVKLTLADNSSQMDIKMRELLAGNAAQTQAVESTKAVNGSILLDANSNVLPGSKISMDLRTLQSDRQIRDSFIKRVTLQTNDFPTVDFVPTQVQGFEGGVPASGQSAFKLIGDATVKGATRPMTWDVTATFGAQGCEGQATTSFKLSDFGLTPPKAGPVISVDDAGSIALSFQAAKSAA